MSPETKREIFLLLLVCVFGISSTLTYLLARPEEAPRLIDDVATTSKQDRVAGAMIRAHMMEWVIMCAHQKGLEKSSREEAQRDCEIVIK